MNLKLGDFVRFVDERLEGFVTRIIDAQQVGVTDDDGFEIPVLASKVTVVTAATSSMAEPDDEEEAPAIPETDLVLEPDELIVKGVYIAVAQDERAKGVVHLFLVNETTLTMQLTLTTERNKRFKGDFIGMVAPLSALQLKSMAMQDFESWPTLHFQALFFTASDLKPQKPLEAVLKMRARDFAPAKKKHELMAEPVWLFRLDEPEVIIDPEVLKASFFSQSVKPEPVEKKVDKPNTEVDLHIEKLREDFKSLNNAEMLKYQLDIFKTTLDAAIVHKMPSIVFIHGIGNGVLRDELYRVLCKHHLVKTYRDAKKEKFGYGATEVILK